MHSDDRFQDFRNKMMDDNSIEITSFAVDFDPLIRAIMRCDGMPYRQHRNAGMGIANDKIFCVTHHRPFRQIFSRCFSAHTTAQNT